MGKVGGGDGEVDGGDEKAIGEMSEGVSCWE